jgi:hypothetical protein
MSAPVKTKVRRDYRGKDGEKLPGVTTILGDTLGWSKTGLMMWAAKEAAKAALAMLDEGGSHDEIVERARKAHLKIRDDAADAGTLAHAFCEIYLRTGVGPPEPDGFDEDDERTARARAAFNRFAAWWPTSGFTVVMLETPLVDADTGYGGTIDYLLRDASGRLLIADLKSGKGVYSEVSLQLGAYAALLALHGHRIDGGLIIHSPVDGDFSVVPVTLEQLDLGARAFVSLLFVYQSKSALKLAVDQGGGL